MSTDDKRMREEKNARRRKRYAEDPEYRERRIDSSHRHWAAHQEEIKADLRRRWATDPDYRARLLAKQRKSYRKAVLMRHGITLEEYDLLLALQGGVCAICKKKPKRYLCVDHCHRTGRIRGLLCNKCNSGLGFYDDDPNRMEAGTAYLRAGQERLEAGADVMASTDQQGETGRALGLGQRAILHELQRQPGQAHGGAANKLQLIARRLVDKAADGDLQAIREVLDRIDGNCLQRARDLMPAVAGAK